MDGQRQKIQQRLAFMDAPKGAAPRRARQGTEPSAVKRGTESPAREERLMEEVCERENFVKAWKQVRGNKGSPGVDGKTIDETLDDLHKHWANHSGTVASRNVQAATRAEGGNPEAERRGQEIGHPYGARPTDPASGVTGSAEALGPDVLQTQLWLSSGRSAHQAVEQAQAYIAEGYQWVVDIDLEKFFDRVNHDLLMARVAKRVADKRLLKLIRAFLTAGVMEDGLVCPADEGTPQDGPLSPLLSNLVLDDLDRELERRGHHFCRYADDCNIYVRSRRAGERVMASVCRFLTKKLRLKVNESKSAVAHPDERKFLGFRLTTGAEPQRLISPQALQRFQARVRELTSRTRGISIERMIGSLKPYLLGWRSYFGFSQDPLVLRNLDARIRRRLRMVIWRQWGKGPTRYVNLRRLGVPHMRAAVAAGSPTGLWAMSRHAAVQQALPNVYFDSLSLPRLSASSNA